ncbi:hypothetical protein C4580_03050 [Candidatus Woesearchaeota archaeon]|nr:MAG: hypothetical protein C4580_03050 [Candidatus Woesearchaeota archaeon]
MDERALYFDNGELQGNYQKSLLHMESDGQIIGIRQLSLDAELFDDGTQKVCPYALEIRVKVGVSVDVFRFSDAETVSGLFGKLGAKTFDELLGKAVSVHYDAARTPPLRAISVPRQE